MRSTIVSLISVGVVNAGEKLIWEDNFDTLDLNRWEHELNRSGGGNGEFEEYRNNRSNSFTRDGVLYIQPNLAFNYSDEESLSNEASKVSGGEPADASNNTGATANDFKPIMSARMKTVNSFSFKYGRVETRAKMPKGDWIWPAIWFLPTHSEYGPWPASGEIDVVESRGNSPSCSAGGNDSFGSTLHMGPDWRNDAWYTAHSGYKHNASLGDDVHIYGLIWTDKRIQTYFDHPNNIVLDIDMSHISNWERGNFPRNF
jgi:beta-glucanase (GH16 family)